MSEKKTVNKKNMPAARSIPASKDVACEIICPQRDLWPEKRVAILGGSFNPVHNGHLRLAVEVLEAIKPMRLDIVPCGNPPHKLLQGLLPFGMRVDMIKESVSTLSNVRVSTMEGENKDKSYTIDTLSYYQEKEPDIRHYFILGGADFSNFDSWKDWGKIPSKGDLVVASRAGSERETFHNDILRFWPDAVKVSAPYGRLVYTLPGGGHVMHLPIPRLDLSSSLLRERWMQGRSISFWTPNTVRLFLSAHENTVRKIWEQQ